jgi:hypothetical protein
VRAGGSGRHATLVPARWRRLPDLSSRGCMRRISPARDIQLDEAERAELVPVMDAAVATALVTSELCSLQMARRAERRPGEAGDH